MNPMNRRDGFTLVELMIVIAVIGLLGLVATPGLFAYLPAYRSSGAARALATEMNLARIRAISRNRVQHIAFDPGAGTLKVWEDDDNDWTTTNTLVKTISLAQDHPNVDLGYNAVTGLGGTTISQAAAFGATSAPVRATFLPNGLLADPGEFYLIPSADAGTSRNDRMRAVSVGRAGDVSIFRYTGTAWEAY